MECVYILLIPPPLWAGMCFVDGREDNGIGTKRKLQPTASMFDPVCIETRMVMVQLNRYSWTCKPLLIEKPEQSHLQVGIHDCRWWGPKTELGLVRIKPLSLPG